MISEESVRFYWCVNCGHYGDFGKYKKRKLLCENCGYDDITDFTEEEIKEDERIWKERFKKTPC